MQRFFTLLCCLFFLFINANAQQTFPVNGPTDPRHITYAITNVRLYVDYKTVVDPATILIRDGLILEAGAGVTVPSDAVVYDYKGKTIYPSLIELVSDYGQPELKRPQGNFEDPQLLTNTKGAYDWNQAVKAEVDAYRSFVADTKKAEEWRKLGFGTVLSTQRDGVVRGTAACVLLGDGEEHELILRDRAAAAYSFDKGISTQDYPSSLMGSIALLRQTWYDARWYKEGGNKKEYNITLESFNRNLELPQWFEAGDKQNELRVARIGKEFGVNFLIKGSGDEYERAAELKAAGCRLIVPVAFPDAYDLSDPYDALGISLHQLRNWELAPGNAATLAQQGIEFALTSSDLKNRGDFWKNIRKAIARGLSEEQALKALTATPASFLGLSDKVGALRKGMLANFLVTSKGLFEKDNAILENWVKGKRYQFVDPQLSDLRGNYTVRIANGNSLRLKVGGEAAAPEWYLYDDTSAIKAAASRLGQQVNFSFEAKKREPKGLYRFTGLAEKSAFSGNVLLPSGEWSAWTATLDSAFVPVAKTDSAKKEAPVTATLRYPNMAYGWKELPKATTVLFRNATVWTNESDGILKNADVLISDGKIRQVGSGIKAPEGAEVVDATGMHLTAGIIDEHSHIAISGSVNEATQSSSAEVRIGDVLDADDVQIYRQLAGGVTASHLLHGSANPIGGQTQLIKLRWGRSPEELKFENWPGYIKFALGENVKQSHWGDKQVIRYPQTRMGVEQVYSDYFTRAREYDQAMNAWSKGDPKLRSGIPPRRDLELDALAEILNGKRFITCHSYVQSEINMLMHVADSFGFKMNTFTHILEGYKVADKMKAHGVRGVSSFSDWWAYKYEVYEAIPYNGAIMQKLGLTVGFNSDDPEMARRLNQEAAKAVLYGGMSEEEAWKFVTLNPAKMLRVDDRVGSIKVGKDADLVLWTDHPMSIYAKPSRTYVDGTCYFDLKRDQSLREEIRTERARLTQQQADAKGRGENVQKPSMNAQVIKHCVEEEIHHFE